MSDHDDHDSSPGYWPSVSDLFITLFIIAIAVLAVVFYALLPKNNVTTEKAVVVAVGVDMKHVKEPVNRLRAALDLPPLRDTQTPNEVMAALGQSADAAISKIKELRAQIADQEKRIVVLKSSDSTRTELVRLQGENRDLKKELEELREKLKTIAGQDVMKRIDELERQLNDKPPIIRIDEQREDYRFESGSSVIGQTFAEGMRANEFPRLAKEIIDRQQEGRVKVDTLEIIGHTDGAALSGPGNLDQKLPDLLGDTASTFESLHAGSNNDLGLLRALAVRQQWIDFTKGHPREVLLRSVAIRCYSAGQTILPD
ncbi:MAG TPA: hypothetical protein VGE67_05550, partial [Haloferula sp.]